MVNQEWTKVELFGENRDGEPVRFAIADGDSASKGQLMALVDPRTASQAKISDVVFAGVAAEEHQPGLGVTAISLWRQGIFEVETSGAVLAGAQVAGSSDNRVKPEIGASGAGILGHALETTSANETINVRLNL